MPAVPIRLVKTVGESSCEQTAGAGSIQLRYGRAKTTKEITTANALVEDLDGLLSRRQTL